MKTKTLTLAIAPFLTVIACNESPPRAPATPTAMTVMIRPEAYRDKATAAFAPGATLHSGDQFALRVWVDQPARISVLICAASKKLKLLYTTGATPLAPGSAARVPQQDEAWFELDATKGTETVFIVASRGALADADPDVARTVEQLANGDLTCDPAAAAAPPEASSAPEPAATATPGQALATTDDRFLYKYKGVNVVSGLHDDSGRSKCQSTPSGLAVCRLWFKHE